MQVKDGSFVETLGNTFICQFFSNSTYVLITVIIKLNQKKSEIIVVIQSMNRNAFKRKKSDNFGSFAITLAIPSWSYFL